MSRRSTTEIMTPRPTAPPNEPVRRGHLALAVATIVAGVLITALGVALAWSIVRPGPSWNEARDEAATDLLEASYFAAPGNPVGIRYRCTWADGRPLQGAAMRRYQSQIRQLEHEYDALYALATSTWAPRELLHAPPHPRDHLEAIHNIVRDMAATSGRRRSRVYDTSDPCLGAELPAGQS